MFEQGEVVRITEGPFKDFNATVEEVKDEEKRLNVAVLIFGKRTPLEIGFDHAEKRTSW
ncbi:KOW motif-containing protein [Streptomyces sp. NPDC097981]|uniref:KOW motif-containing protein n=1 Tax=Streptomyces sp. NPDC097981 TaxID=3155428 RepID=UPI0033293208